MNNFLQTGRKLFLPLFVVLLLGLPAIPALAADSDSVDVTVTVEETVACFLKDGQHSTGDDWEDLLALPDLTTITFNIGESEIENGQAFMLYSDTGSYKGRVIWVSNTDWYMKVKRSGWSPDLNSYGVKLWLKPGSLTGTWKEVTETEPDWDVSNDGPTFGSTKLNWKVDKDATDDDGPAWWDVPPDTYVTTVTFTIYG